MGSDKEAAPRRWPRGMGDAAEPAAKRVKIEGDGGGAKMDAKQVEAVVLAECKKHQQWLAPPETPDQAPPKDFERDNLNNNPALKALDSALLLNAINRLINSSRLKLTSHPKGGQCLVYVSEEKARQEIEKFGGLSQNELLVYQKIQESGIKGLFQRDLKSRTGISNPNTIRTIIEKLMKRKLIKDFTSVHTGKKKMYILAGLEPSKELTGGNWYTNGELDQGLVEVCMKMGQCIHTLAERDRQRDRVKKENREKRGGRERERERERERREREAEERERERRERGKVRKRNRGHPVPATGA